MYVPKQSDIDDILAELGITDARRPAALPSLTPAPADAPPPTAAPAAHTQPEPAPAPAATEAAPPRAEIEPEPKLGTGEPVTDLVPLDRRGEDEDASDAASLSIVFQPEAGRRASDLAQLLLERKIITEQQLATSQGIVRQSPGRRLTDVLIEQGAPEVEIQRTVAELSRLPFETINLEKGLDGGFDGQLTQRLTVEFCKQHCVIPLRADGARVVMGITRPDDVFLLDEVRRRLNVPAIKPVMVSAYEVRGALEIVGGGGPEEDNADLTSLLSQVEEGDVQVEKKSDGEVDLEREAAESPVIRYVNYIIQNAIKEGASDIHLEPAEKKLRVRFRIDGVLFEMMNPPASMSAAITSRLKIMANLDISERRVPQDGRIRCQVGGRKLDLRVSTLPNGYGEKTVMRILDTKSINVELDQLGFDENTLAIWKKQIDSPHGIILVTGPTGSGKTTTLYASLRQLDKTSMNISTVEDPVEYHLDGITQTQTHAKIDMTFAKALKALLRQDPDVIMLGEIRDLETAQIAIQAAMTGHLVLSTLHTNDAPSSITRLVNIGIEPFLVGAAVNAVLAQRLVRRLCLHCKEHAPVNEETAEFLVPYGIDPDTVLSAKGCDKCRKSGYSGRVGLYELLVVDDQLRDVVARNPNVAEFRRMCIERGMVTLRSDGMAKVAKGLTSVAEVFSTTEGVH